MEHLQCVYWFCLRFRTCKMMTENDENDWGLTRDTQRGYHKLQKNFYSQIFAIKYYHLTWALDVTDFVGGYKRNS